MYFYHAEHYSLQKAFFLVPQVLINSIYNAFFFQTFLPWRLDVRFANRQKFKGAKSHHENTPI